MMGLKLQRSSIGALITILLICYTSIYPQPGSGYINPFSYTKGDTVEIHISTQKQTFSIEIYREGAFEALVGTYNNIQGGERPVPDSVWEKGCNWPVSFRLAIPESWAPGVYMAKFPNLKGDGPSYALFAVKEKSPGSHSKLLIVMPDFNWAAYNFWGGKNVYDENSTDGKRAHRVTFNRPYNSNGLSEFKWYPYKLLAWLEKNGYAYEAASEKDIHYNPEFIKNYDVVVQVGHDEYYTRSQRESMLNFINQGGRLVILSGNTCWWQIRIEDEGNTLVCYKDRNLDPLSGKVDSMVTVNWYQPPLNYPENNLIGVSFRYGGYVNDIYHKDFTYYQGFGDYAVFNSQNWVYKGTGLKDGDEFGRPLNDSANAIVGYEVDGTLHTWKNGLPEVTGLDGTPQNFRLLGHSPAIGQGAVFENRFASMGVFYTKKGGAVFNAATIYWARGLDWDTSTQKIMKNVIDKFKSNRLPPEITGWSPFRLVTDTVNNEVLQINKRDFEINSGDSVKFTLKVQDPYNSKVNYLWYVDTIKISTDSTYTYRSKGGGIYTVKAIVYNSKDTTELSWKMTVIGPPNAVNEKKSMQLKYSLEQNYPNPFNPETKITYSLAKESMVRLWIYNVLGQEVAQLVNRQEQAGSHSISWNATSFPSGIYFYSIDASAINGRESFRLVRKMMLVK
ncbi:MAG: N,N-dimethylformamidase beta subunit family domain-containing protein [Bacillota bacterium]